MDQQPYPWRKDRELDAVLAEAKPVLVSLGVVAPGAGCSEAEIVLAERRSRAFPPEVQSFYRAMRPTELFSRDSKSEFGFYPISADELSWKPMDAAEPAADWVGASGLFLGQSTYGDPFWWAEGHRSLPDGSIFLLDHDGGLGGDIMFVHFARSFRELLSKLVFYKNLYSPTQDELFRREYFELNPSAKR